jgi:hypothetical protein
VTGLGRYVVGYLFGLEHLIILLCLFISMVYSLDGYAAYSWGTTTDVDGVETEMARDYACVLSGITGDLSRGKEQVGTLNPWKNCEYNWGYHSQARTDMSNGKWRVIAHGAACGPIWWNNPVNAQATCFPFPTSVEGTFIALSYYYMAEIKPGRKCFLSGIIGGSKGYRGWENTDTFVRIREVTESGGFYIESNLGWDSNGQIEQVASERPRVEYQCVDFPVDSKQFEFTTGTITKSQTARTVRIASGGGIKACALTGISGAFNVDSWTDGVSMSFPSTATGNWYLTVTAGKSATWLCVR